MNHSLLLVLAGAVLAAFVNLVWETLDYGFPDDLMRPTSNKEHIDISFDWFKSRSFHDI